jgi:hypothetical protein
LSEKPAGITLGRLSADYPCHRCMPAAGRIFSKLDFSKISMRNTFV